jgi:hypothetical protein
VYGCFFRRGDMGGEMGRAEPLSPYRVRRGAAPADDIRRIEGRRRP